MAGDTNVLFVLFIVKLVMVHASTLIPEQSTMTQVNLQSHTQTTLEQLNNTTSSITPEYTESVSTTPEYTESVSTTSNKMNETSIPYTSTSTILPMHHFRHSGSVKSENECPSLNNGDIYTQAEFLNRLTHPCRYDRLTRPGGNVKGSTYKGGHDQPLDIWVQIDIQHIEAAEQLQFKMHMLLQYRYLDPRLDYRNVSPSRSRIVGEDVLRSKLWVPHVLLENEKDSGIMGHDARDIYLEIDPNGLVTYAKRVRATLYCWMNLQKFPFDEQICEVRLLSWTYNANELMLRWEKEEPVIVARQLHLTEYTLLKHWTETNIITFKHNKGAFNGNYSSLTFKFEIAREIGFYMLDYFLPSIMLVCISWVSFWLQADASAPRITLGTSTMLSFITLASAQTRTLPKVSYIKASEVWFLGCTIFIFGSMVEFAFVNIIWRRKANVELKKVNSKYILKSTLTPKLHRKELQKGGLQKSHSCSSLDSPVDFSKPPQYNNYLTVHSFSGGVPKIITESADDLVTTEKKSYDSFSIQIPENGDNLHGGWTTMTPQEIAQWIDRRSRLVFPCAFIVFNAFYWGFVYWL